MNAGIFDQILGWMFCFALVCNFDVLKEDQFLIKINKKDWKINKKAIDFGTPNDVI